MLDHQRRRLVMIESPWPMSRTETRRVPVVVPLTVQVAAGVEETETETGIGTVVRNQDRCNPLRPQDNVPAGRLS